MSQKPAVLPYRLLAEHYDAIFAPVRAPLDKARNAILRQILPTAGSACDLGCGTGSTALAFARAGIEATAVDLSPHMCRLARDKARQAGLALRVIRADMRSFRLPHPVDLVTCECDALNHLPRKSDLGPVFRAVRHALLPGGCFYFDVNTAKGFRHYWTDALCVERPGVVLVMRSGHDIAAGRAWTDVDWFVRTQSLWRRHRERVEEVCWAPSEIRRALRQAGFGRIRSFDAAPFFRDGVTVPGCRTIYLAHRMS